MPVLTRFALLAAALLAGVHAAPADCVSESFEESGFIVCSFDLPESDIRFFWRHPDGEAFGTFTALAGHLEGKGQRLVFATNGGMYGEDFSPIGLYIEGGQELAPVNTREAPANVRPVPNFYKKPNGIFYIGRDGAGVMTTEAFLARRPDVRFATQSGPMLVIDGEVHPVFIPGSSDRNPRNGVCAPTPDKVHFVITEGTVNFHDFARFFRDRLKCKDALFLDGGSASALYAPELGRNDGPGHGGFGPIIAVVTKAPGT
ncbi:MAG TPA: phosphodiester glycosidase family protein [Bauldia sp.]|nr:phosphodiester glycosidase family protein [Bauldia sp.]